jgi:hypothetical protein
MSTDESQREKERSWSGLIALRSIHLPGELAGAPIVLENHLRSSASKIYWVEAPTRTGAHEENHESPKARKHEKENIPCLSSWSPRSSLLSGFRSFGIS